MYVVIEIPAVGNGSCCDASALFMERDREPTRPCSSPRFCKLRIYKLLDYQKGKSIAIQKKLYKLDFFIFVCRLKYFGYTFVLEKNYINWASLDFQYGCMPSTYLLEYGYCTTFLLYYKLHRI
jgi:hypothetical protein